MRILSEGSLNKFQVCGKALNRSCDLTRHIRTHSMEKPNACEICGKAFAQSGNLNIHNKYIILDRTAKFTFLFCEFCFHIDDKSINIRMLASDLHVYPLTWLNAPVCG